MKLLKYTKKFFKRSLLTKVLFLFLSWRFLTLVFALLGINYLPIRGEGFLGGGLENYLKNPLLWGWANYDGEHYIFIARHGYKELLYFFFPLYPQLIIWVKQFIGTGFRDYLLSGLLISNLAFPLAIFSFWKLVRLDYKRDVAFYSVLALLLFPTSFFFGAVYAEGLFFLLIILSFYFARKGNFFLAGVFAALASATRLVGIFLFPVLFLEWLERKDKKESLFSLLGVFLSPLGLMLYMLYLLDRTGNPLIFFQQISHFGQQRSGEFVLLYQVFWRYAKMILTVTKSDPLYFTILMEALSGVLGLTLLIWGYVRKMRLSYWLFALLSYIAPTFTGSFSSLPRYTLTIFPFFILLGLFLAGRGRVSRYVYFTLSAALLLVETALFIRGYWVA